MNKLQLTPDQIALFKGHGTMITHGDRTRFCLPFYIEIDDESKGQVTLITPNEQIQSKEEEPELYYIQNGYVGNSILWWAIDSRGYVTDINKAGKYTKESAMRIIERPQDIAWPCSYIDGAIEAQKLTIDAQALNHSYKIVGKTK
jgi:hypothetical protein